MDNIDKMILELLEEDSKQNFKTIGDKIHMTGQAVGNRVRKLEDSGIIESYTIKINTKKQGMITAYIMLFMKSNSHYLVKDFADNNDEVKEVMRISGEGCYILKVIVSEHSTLNKLCDDILKFANYRINVVTDTIK